jgi:hypothetical protein
MLRTIFGVLGALYLLKLTGFCFSAPGYLSNRTLIEAALKFETSFKAHPPAFQDAAAFLRDHPDCCTVRRWSDPFLGGQSLNALFGRRFFAVDVTYPVSPEGGYEDPYYNSILIMDCCGAYIPDYYGIGTRSLPAP